MTILVWEIPLESTKFRQMILAWAMALCPTRRRNKQAHNLDQGRSLSSNPPAGSAVGGTERVRAAQSRPHSERKVVLYDKELKRWVNKKAGAEATKPAAPPPPPARAQTASPGHTAPRIPTSATLAPPPARAASAIDLTASPPKRMVPRPRSTLAPTEGENNGNDLLPSPGLTASPSPVPSGSPTPPPSRPRSQATKRNLRSRYVDVFHQPTTET